MKPVRSPLAPAVLALLSVAAGALIAPNHLRATGSASPSPYLDDDGDGLDNATEQRLGTPVDIADVDGDGLNDLAELLAGTDPLVAQLPSEVPPSHPLVKLEAYATKTQFVIQVFAQHQTSLNLLRYYVATANGYFMIPSSSLQRFLTRQQVLAGHQAGYEVTSLRYFIPLKYFTRAGTFSFAVQANVDQNLRVADEIRFQNDNPLRTLQEWRTHGVQQGNPGGGLFPANPNLPPPNEALIDQVCIQELQATGTIGAGGILYSVSDAYCDTLMQATCIPACPASVGSTVIGIDIASLIN